jgi:hypothetical protein
MTILCLEGPQSLQFCCKSLVFPLRAFGSFASLASALAFLSLNDVFRLSFRGALFMWNIFIIVHVMAVIYTFISIMSSSRTNQAFV